MDFLVDFGKFFVSRLDLIVPEFFRHVQMSLLAIVLSVGIGVPAALLLIHAPRASRVVQSALSVVQTIPSLALLGFLIPLVGIGFKPSIIALVLYSLLVIVQNTMVGIRQIQPSIIESAIGMGMNKLQVLLQVQIPLALPVIIAGIRVASVTCIGIATIAATIGAGGLGAVIYRGIALVDKRLIIAGALPAAALAVCADAFFGLLERYVKAKNKT